MFVFLAFPPKKKTEKGEKKKKSQNKEIKTIYRKKKKTITGTTNKSFIKHVGNLREVTLMIYPFIWNYLSLMLPWTTTKQARVR